MASDDGDKWDTYNGTYCETLEEATDVFQKKTGTDYQRQAEALATQMRIERNLNV
jgi:predicted component of type VI protein secretion system